MGGNRGEGGVRLLVFGIPPLGNRISYYRIGWQKSASQLWLIFDASAGTMIGPSFAGNACANGQDAMNKATSHPLAICNSFPFRQTLGPPPL